MKVVTTITSGELTEGTYVEGLSVGYTKTGRESFRSTWAGTFQGIEKDRHGGPEDYAYFTGGHVNGRVQGAHGFPVSNLEA